MTKQKPYGVCCFCGKPFTAPYAKNNPWPVKGDGDCCDSCNASVVVPAREPHGFVSVDIAKLFKQ